MLSTQTNTAQVIDQLKEVKTLMGKTISLTNMKGEHGNTVIYFFAPWCQICHASIGNLQDLYEKNNKINVIAVALDYSSIDEVRAFSKQHHLTFPIALGTEAIKQAYSVSGYPSYYVIDEYNTVISKSMGYSSEVGLYLRSL